MATDPHFFHKAMRGHSQCKLLALDPGETTGWAFFQGEDLIESGQVKGMTVPECYVQLSKIIDKMYPHFIVIEDYKVYGWKTKDHAWSELFTPRLIGALECYISGVGCFMFRKQMAQQAKGFCTDDKLKAWGLWPEGRHARDAVRHAVYYLLFEVAKVHQLRLTVNEETPT